MDNARSFWNLVGRVGEEGWRGRRLDFSLEVLGLYGVRGILYDKG